MSDEGKQILESTRKLRSYLKDIGNLLSTAEGMLTKRGFKGDNQAVFKQGTADIRWPEWWFPQDAFRFLYKDNARFLVVISVIMDDIGSPASLEQPIVSAAWYKYRKESVEYNWDVSFSRNILKLQQFELDGKMIDIRPELITPRIQIEGGAVSSSQALVVPLVDIQSERDIEEKIINPLVESLDGKIN